MPAWKVVHADDMEYETAESEIASGLQTCHLIGAVDGAVHLQVTLSRLAPGGTIDAHVHPFEESFYVLEGDGIVAVADQAYRVSAGSYGFAPIRTPHRWSNDSDRPLVWVRTRSPQARPLGGAHGTYPVDVEVPGDEQAKPSDVRDRVRRFVGRYREEMMPVPGPLQMKGIRAPEATNVAVWMLVDEAMGALHHTKFCVRFDPTGPEMTLGGQHLHPFEETYYITDGAAIAHLEAESIEVGPGDLIFAGVNALHGFSNTASQPVRWIEMQAPNPPISDAFFFSADWEI